MKCFEKAALAAVLLAALAGAAHAQTIPPGQSCGGLLCDMGIFGHKVPVGPNGEAAPPAVVAAVVAREEAADPHRLPCHDFLCRAFGQPDADAVPPPPPEAAPVAAEPAPGTRAVKHRRHAAKVASRSAAPPETADPVGANAK